MGYSQGFKGRMVQRMLGSEAISATALSTEAGVSQATLSRWLNQARMLSPMNREQNERAKPARSPRQWTVEEKLQVVVEASALSDEELGAFLRGKGLHMAQLAEWRESASQSLDDGKKKRRRKMSPEQKRIRELEKELRRKDRALAEVTALLVLKKKAEEIWGDGGDDTRTRSGT